LVGYAGTNQYRLYDPATQTVIISRNVQFNDSSINLNKDMSYNMELDMELDMDDLLEEQEAEAKEEKKKQVPEPEDSDEDQGSEYQDSDTEFVAPKSPPWAVAPANPPRRFKQTNISIPARRYVGVVIIIDLRIAQMQTANISVQDRATPKSYANMQLLPENERKL
jgi:hypothetical protein